MSGSHADLIPLFGPRALRCRAERPALPDRLLVHGNSPSLSTSVSLADALIPWVARQEELRHVRGVLHHILAPILAATPPAQPVVPDLWADGAIALERLPIDISHVEVHISLIDGLELEITYDLRGVGTVTIAVDHDESGSGFGLVLVGDETFAEVVFRDGIIDGRSIDLVDLAPQQAQAMAASMVQIWEREEVSRRVSAAALESRGLGCWIAGKMSGAVSGVLVAGSCQAAVPLPGVCELAGVEVFNKVSGYIEGKCDKAQNG